MTSFISNEAPPENFCEDLLWINRNFKIIDGKTIIQANIIDSDISGGFNAKMSMIELKLSDESTIRYIIKKTPKERERTTQLLGTPRESLFYNYFTDLTKLNIAIPYTVYAYGNMETGAKFIVIEDLTKTAINSGYFFGKGSPLNWNINLDLYTSLDIFSNINMCLEVSKLAFSTAAIMHGRYFMDRSILSINWLRGSSWINGLDKQSWLDAQNRGKSDWLATKSKIGESNYAVRWDDRLVSCIDSSMEKISWDDYQTSLKSDYWTLVHGDYHPSNMMITKSNPFKLYVLDWEVVGIGSGPQDVAQYLISHMTPSERKLYEDELLELYFEVFSSNCNNTQLSEYTFEKCKIDYVLGGIGRWIWFLGVLGVMCPDKMVQYFHDQVLAFMIDHNITSANVPMPRV